MTYADGLVYSYTAEYGYSVGDKKLDFAPLPQKFPVKSAEDESGVSNNGRELVQPAATCNFKDSWYEGIAATADIYPVETKDGIRSVYATTFKNRHPGVAIESVKFYLPMTIENVDLPVCGEVDIYGIFA